MPTHLNLRQEEILDLWPHIEKYQEIAAQYGINDIFQDAGGKMLQLAVAVGLDMSKDRMGPDAFDRIGNEYEVKTTDLNKKGNGFSTNHHLTHSTIDRYSSRRWVFAMYRGITLIEAYLVEPEALQPYYDKWALVLKSKSHINNPKISADYVRDVGRVMYMKDVPPPWEYRDED